MPKNALIPQSFFSMLLFIFGGILLAVSLMLGIMRQKPSNAYRVVYREITNQGAFSQQTRIMSMFPDGSHSRSLMTYQGQNVGNSHPLTWTPDGEAILYVKRFNNDLSIFRLNYRTQFETLLIANSKAPTLAPNGKYLAYEQDAQIKVMDYSTERIILESADFVEQTHRLPTWSPDGDVLFFSVYEESRLYQIDMATLIASEFDFDQSSSENYILTSFAWSPNAEWLAILIQFSTNSAGQLIFWQPDYQRKRSFESQNFGDVRIEWSPNGRSLSYPTEWMIMVDEVETRVEKSLPFGTHANSGAVWSPDGKWLYFVRERNQSWQIYRRSADHSITERLTTTPSSQIFPTVSPLIDLNWHGIIPGLFSGLMLAHKGRLFVKGLMLKYQEFLEKIWSSFYKRLKRFFSDFFGDYT